MHHTNAGRYIGPHYLSRALLCQITPAENMNYVNLVVKEMKCLGFCVDVDFVLNNVINGMWSDGHQVVSASLYKPSASSCVFMRLHASSCVFMRFHAFSCVFMRFHAISCVSCVFMRFHAISCDFMRFHAFLAITQYYEIKQSMGCCWRSCKMVSSILNQE